MDGHGSGCPQSRACCVTPQTHHPPARARFTGDFVGKFSVPQYRWRHGPPGPGRSSFASWLKGTTQAKRHYSSAVSNPLPPGCETGTTPLDQGVSVGSERNTPSSERCNDKRCRTGQEVDGRSYGVLEVRGTEQHSSQRKWNQKG